jgi:hypothetical protein
MLPENLLSIPFQNSPDSRSARMLMRLKTKRFLALCERKEMFLLAWNTSQIAAASNSWEGQEQALGSKTSNRQE